MPDHFCIVSDHAKLKLVLTNIMSVRQQIVIPALYWLHVLVYESTVNASTPAQPSPAISLSSPVTEVAAQSKEVLVQLLDWLLLQDVVQPLALVQPSHGQDLLNNRTDQFHWLSSFLNYNAKGRDTHTHTHTHRIT